MSGFALIYQLNRSPVEPATLDKFLVGLEHRGSDGRDTWIRGEIGLGHVHFWTTPEEVGERQPLADREGRLVVVFDGRLDNRQDLCSKLGFDAREGLLSSDAALVLAAYRRWGTECLPHFLGSFAFALYDSDNHHVFCGRDAVGDRSLYYYCDAHVLLVATHPSPLFAYPGLSPRLNDVAIAHYFAFRVPEDGSTVFHGIKELLPANGLLIGPEGNRDWTYWQADPERRIHYRDDHEYAEHLLELIRAAVVCRLRSNGPPAVMMSGGLDSTTVAALAAGHLGSQTPARRLRTVSYVYDEVVACDEREYIEPVVQRYGLESVQILGDSMWPLRDAATWPLNPNTPHTVPFARLHLAVYDAVTRGQGRVILTGSFGDNLYYAADYWLADLLSEGRFFEGAKELGWHCRHQRLTDVLRSMTVRRVARRMLDLVPGARRLHPRRYTRRTEWLTERARRSVPAPERWPAGLTMASRPEHFLMLLGLSYPAGVQASRWLTNSSGVEIREPYRDRRLIEFVLSLPAQEFYRRGYWKHILRVAVRDHLPEKLWARRGRTSSQPLFELGLADRGAAVTREILSPPGACWRRYMASDWLAAEGLGPGIRDLSQTDQALLWMCVSFELWLKRFGYGF